MRITGFTLLELLICLTILGLFSSGFVLWHQVFYQQTQARHQQAETRAYLYNWLQWIWRDIQLNLAFHSWVQAPLAQQEAAIQVTEEESQVEKNWTFFPESHCLLYGRYGIRVKNQSLQWRPHQASCVDPGWQALTDPQQAQILGLSLQGEELCLVAQDKKQPAARRQASKSQPMEVCLPWRF